MERPLDYLNNCVRDDRLIGCKNSQFQELAQELYLELTQLLTYKSTLKIILAEREPERFLAGFIAACAANCPVFLCNPDWGKQEWQQVFNLVQPDIVWGMREEDAGTRGRNDAEIRGYFHLPNPPHPPHPYSALPCTDAINRVSQHSALIMIPTGGSSGQIKFAMHTWETLMASVRGFTEYFQIKQVNSFCVLPLYHVSGLMQFMRSFTTSGQLAILPFKTVESGQIYNINSSEFFISLVPTQLQRLLQNPQLTEWLTQFATVLLGGAPAWHELLEKARFHSIRLAPTYGMTETASQIATLKPDDFLNGKINSGKILPHAQIKICARQGQVLDSNQIGNITIETKSLALGYYPHTWSDRNYFQVDDLGFFDEQGYLNIVGRSSEKIITGGENIYPAEIESAIRETQMIADICVIGVSDKYWGQALTALYVPKNSNTSTLEIQSVLKDKLTKFKIPKHWIPLSTLPRNSQGKINRQQLQQIATEFLLSTND